MRGGKMSMLTLLDTKPKKDKGYHIRNFDPKARRLARAGASVAGVDIGAWISQAVREKFARDISKAPAQEADL
jgi:hypothetical protein